MTNPLRKVSIYPSLEARKQKEDFATNIPYTIEREPIPKDAHKFYKSFGYLVHPRTGKEVERLTPYQYSIWNCRAQTVLVVKSQKTGISTSELIHDFQEVLLNPGHDLLIVGQTEQHALEHLYTLKRLIIDSDRYRKYLITDSNELYFKEEKTKVHVLYIKNPDNPYRPSRIIGVGFSVSALWSWKNVFRIHMSDPAAAQVIDDSGIYAALMSRLTNTDGRLLIEGGPRGPVGRFYELYEQFKNNKDPKFRVFTITIYDALKYGLVTQEFIDKVKVELGQLYSQTYEASFVQGVGDVFESSLITRSVELGDQLIKKYPEIDPRNLTILSIDPGFGSSPTSVLLAEQIESEDKILVRFTREYHRPNPHEIAQSAFDYYRKYWNLWILIDSAGAGLITEIKAMIGENTEDQYTEEVSPQSAKVIPIPFNKYGKLLLSRLHLLMYKNAVGISSEHQDLIKSLMTAKADRYQLLKDQTAHSDLLDSLRMLTYSIYLK